MAILVTGSTGTIGTQVLNHLAGHGVEVRALTRSPGKAQFPQHVKAVRGDLTDMDSVRAALDGVSTLFLLVPNVADELTQAMLTLTAAREAGVKGIVYLSVFKGEAYADVPHFAGKHTVERMIEALDLPATILHPAYFIQNDLRLKEPLVNFGAYGMPIGAKGISMVDIRDIGEAAAIELVRRERAPAPLGRETYALVGPDVITGEGAAAIWRDVLGRAVSYGGDDLAATEQRLKAAMPAWLALDMRLMLGRYQSHGAVATADDLARLTRLLGRAPRAYRDFARDAAAQWRKG
ncbi:NmrA/HSCARG family protein [Bradyrhizobium septentrionale]|uniref:NmrA/HSCARG family protein n=1 Tax=Bradyrhizobium septentrionale TaxID=1404411 RepID=A0A974A3L8_9BRAD|nr:NmrA/HSCARG family protein [Bradyrhizobium septentrionale]UGY17263.1 NmrA/HSCARG family protein [Bradyrhizobium septentrionale]UGY26007.1 NmrA/HSCARG family protein [Bradyrhizobium septentrionale]